MPKLPLPRWLRVNLSGGCSNRTKIVERQVKFNWENIQRFQANASAGIRHVADAACEYTGSSAEKEQRPPVD
jgi:hypothetical protein